MTYITQSIVSKGKNIGNSNLVVSQTGTRSLRMAGNTSADEVVIRDSGNLADLFRVQGDGNSAFISNNINIIHSIGCTIGSVERVFTTFSTGGSNTHPSVPWDFQSKRAGSQFAMEITNINSHFVLAQGNMCLSGSSQLTSTTVTDRGSLWLKNDVAPIAGFLNGVKVYAKDVAASSVLHIMNESGIQIKLYQETTAVASAAFVANTSGIVNDTATYGGYTMGQVVQSLKNHGLLQ